MRIIEAKYAGLKAFEAGMGRAPALNKEFTTAIFSQKDTKATLLMDAYLYGWDIANLANNSIPGSPSVMSYNIIIEEYNETKE